MATLRAATLFAALTLALTWPFAANLRVMDAGDSAFFAWEVGWTLHALFTDPPSLPHANIFHPLRYTLGLDEPVLGTTLLALPLALFTDDAVLLYNVVRLLTWFVSALTAYFLARGLGAGEGPALVGGALYAFSPIRTDQVAHLSTLGTQWWPLLLLFIVRFARQGRPKDALLAGLFYVLSFLACGYHGVIAAAVLPVPLLVWFWGRRDRIAWGAVAVVLAGLLLWPVYAMHQQALAPERYVRGTEETILYSAALDSFLAASSWNRLYAGATEPFRAFGPNNLFPGLLAPALALAAALRLRRDQERPSRDAWALLALALGTVLVALGPRIRLFEFDLLPGPWALLREAIPAFQMIRVTSRAGIFLALALSMLAAMALERLRLSPRAVAALGLFGLLETLIVPIPMPEWSKVVDTRREPPPVYRWLRDQPGRDPVVHLPMLDVRGLERRPAFHESVYMVHSTLHWKPLVNGYAGIEPRRYVQIRSLARGFPSEAFLSALRSIGTRYVVVHRKGYGPNQWARLQAGLPRALEGSLREAARFGDDIVYELR